MNARIFILALVCVTGCSTSQSATAPYTATSVALRDAPDRFLVGTHTDTSTSEPTAGEGCRNPMVDPRDGTRAVLVRSSEGRGDYRVPEGRYGVPARHLLRIDCATGAPLGIVRR